jgi:hypothetical protein
MLPDDTRSKIKNITAGVIIEGSQDNCTADRNLLCASFPTSTTIKEYFEGKAVIKEEQARLIEKYRYLILYNYSRAGLKFIKGVYRFPMGYFQSLHFGILYGLS